MPTTAPEPSPRLPSSSHPSRGIARTMMALLVVLAMFGGCARDIVGRAAGPSGAIGDVAAGPASSDDQAGSRSPNAELEAELRAALDEWSASSRAPGVSLAVRLPDGSTIALGSGTADLATDDAMSPDAFLRFASITKSMTAATVVDLAEDGLVDLDARVVDILGPDWAGEHPSSDIITVRQLLDHTSGLSEYAFTRAFAAEASSRYGRAWSPEELLEFVGRQGADHRPGERFAYNTGGFIAAGLVIEAVTGQSAAEAMTERLFAPAGAESIHLTPQDVPPSPVVAGYAAGTLRQVLAGADPSVDEGLRLADGEPVVNVLAANQASLQSGGWTGGGIEATASSVAAVWQAMFDTTVLGPEWTDELIAPATSVRYGLGVEVRSIGGTTVYAHSGGTAGYSSEAGYLADHNVSFAVSANASGVPVDLDGLLSEIVPLAVAVARQAE